MSKQPAYVEFELQGGQASPRRTRRSMPLAVDVTVTRQMESPLGPLSITADALGIRSIDWLDELDLTNGTPLPSRRDGAAVQASLDVEQRAMAEGQANQAVDELQDYFRGTRQTFSVPLSTVGTPFQHAVWDALLHIPYGETRSYLDIAMAIGKPKAVRAVGQANRANPVPVIVPCHRVIGKNGDLVGYAGSQVHLKATLLELERAQMSQAGGPV